MGEIDGGTVVLFMSDNLGRYGTYCCLLNRENPKMQIKKYDSIKAGNYYVDVNNGCFDTYDESLVSVFKK